MPLTPWTPFGSAVNDATSGAVAWIDPANALIDNTGSTSAALGASPNNTTQILAMTGADFSALDDDDTIEGIEVRFRRRQSASAARDLSVSLRQGGVAVGDNKAASTNWPTTPTFATYGSLSHGINDLWGAGPLTGADVKDSGFGIQIRAQRSSGTPTANVEYAEIRLLYTQNLSVSKMTAAAPTHLGGADGQGVAKMTAGVLTHPGERDQIGVPKADTYVLTHLGEVGKLGVSKMAVYVIVEDAPAGSTRRRPQAVMC